MQSRTGAVRPNDDSYWVVPGRFLAGGYPVDLTFLRGIGISVFIDPVTLSAGRNSVAVTMTAEDGMTQKIHLLSVSRGVTGAKGWQAGADLDGLYAAANPDPWGIRSNDATMWVADTDDGRVCAYTLSNGSRDKPDNLSAAPRTGSCRSGGDR